jgi:hypothetical protein
MNIAAEQVCYLLFLPYYSGNMKTRNLLLTVGAILILFNSLSYLSGKTKEPNDKSVAYWIGNNFLFISGFILFLIAFMIHRKVIRKRKKEMVDSLFK